MPACDAYTGAPFKVNRAYAERFGERWIILSAKYGFISPLFQIPGPYNITFKSKSTDPVSLSTLKQQIAIQGLDHFPIVIGLGGKEYCCTIKQAFAPLSGELRFPFAGLPIGKSMQAIRCAIDDGNPFPEVGLGDVEPPHQLCDTSERFDDRIELEGIP